MGSKTNELAQEIIHHSIHTHCQVASNQVLNELSPNQLLVAHMDDPFLKKTGKNVFGTCNLSHFGRF